MIVNADFVVEAAKKTLTAGAARERRGGMVVDND